MRLKEFHEKRNCQRKQCLRGSTKTCQIWESAFLIFYCYDNYLFIHLWKMLIFSFISDNGVQGPECSICYEGYNDEKKCPRLLSCGHSFCSSCLERLLHGNSIYCPKCRQKKFNRGREESVLWRFYCFVSGEIFNDLNFKMQLIQGKFQWALLIFGILF